MDWVIYFPRCGNKGKYLSYVVMFVDRKKGNNKPERIVKLKEVMENSEFERRYPHMVGYYKQCRGEGAPFKPEYLEIRKINTAEDFCLFLNALDI